MADVDLRRVGVEIIVLVRRDSVNAEQYPSLQDASANSSGRGGFLNGLGWDLGDGVGHSFGYKWISVMNLKHV